MINISWLNQGIFQTMIAQTSLSLTKVNLKGKKFKTADMLLVSLLLKMNKWKYRLQKKLIYLFFGKKSQYIFLAKYETSFFFFFYHQCRNVKSSTKMFHANICINILSVYKIWAWLSEFVSQLKDTMHITMQNWFCTCLWSNSNVGNKLGTKSNTYIYILA